MNLFFRDCLPIILSFLAILVTLYTVNKQNRIALFEIRYKAYNVFSYLLSVTDTILKEDVSNTNVVLYHSMETYRSIVSLSDTLPNSNDVSSFYTGLVFEVGKAEHIFKKKYTNNIMHFLIAFNNLVSSIYAKKSYEIEIEQLRNAYYKLEKDNIAQKIKKYLKV